MSRPWQIWGLFSSCLIVVLVAMGWITQIALQLERSEQETRRHAELEENVRLALWRMESTLAPLIAEESGRPYFAYSPFYAPERAYTRMFSEILPGEILVPSPLLTDTPSRILLHFQIDPDGQMSSPQVPEGNMRDLAETGYTTRERIQISQARLAELASLLDAAAILEQLSAPVSQPEAWESRAVSVQQQRSVVERQARMQHQFANALNIGIDVSATVSEVSGSGIKPLWLGDALLLARRVSVRGKQYIQGCWLDWARIRQRLKRETEDLLPSLSLEPAEPGALASDPRLLAALPVRLVPGEPPAPSGHGLSPIRVSLTIAWACVLIAATAVAILLRGTVSLSERRAAFVSAVSHEMRTPLTTFRMYTDMLLKDMIPDGEKRRRYLKTLRTEAQRLGHLVENVLSYARLERSRDRQPPETLTLRELIGRMEDRLAARAGQAEMKLIIEAEELVAEHRVHVDTSAVEQILFNLVDNACKYADTSPTRLIHLEVSHQAGQSFIEVRDHGPGVSQADSRRLFRPFCKSARDAAHSAPGVGLGLALSRRLARSMGGDLRLNKNYEDGASFILTLPETRAIRR